MHQLGQLSRYAAEIMQDIHKETTTANIRLNHVHDRIENVSKHFSADSSQCKTTVEVTETAEKLKSLSIQPDEEDLIYGLVSRSKRPQWLQQKYEKLENSPNFEDLDQYWSTENQPCRKRYSNPEFFYETWLRNENARLKVSKQKFEEQKQTRKQLRSEQKREKKLKVSEKKKPSLNIRTWTDVRNSRTVTTYFDPSKANVNVIRPISDRKKDTSLFQDAAARKPQLETFRENKLKHEQEKEKSKRKREEQEKREKDASMEEYDKPIEIDDTIVYYEDTMAETYSESHTKRGNFARQESTLIGETIHAQPRKTPKESEQTSNQQPQTEVPRTQPQSEDKSEKPSPEEATKPPQHAEGVNNTAQGEEPLKAPTEGVKDKSQGGGTAKPALSRPPPAPMGGGRGNLLADIRQGKPLQKKKKHAAPNPAETVKPSAKSTSSESKPASEGAKATPKAGGLLAEIHQGAMLKRVSKKTDRSTVPGGSKSKGANSKVSSLIAFWISLF